MLVGTAALVILAMLRDPPARHVATELARTLRVIRVTPIDVVPRVVGYGTSRPARVVRVVLEVSGRVVSIHSELRAGAIIAQGDELLRIDPAEYELAIALYKADNAQIDAQIAELDGQDKNLQISLQIEVESLALVEADLARTREAFETQAANQQEFDERKRATLTQRQVVQDLRNSLNLLPAQRQASQFAQPRRRLCVPHFSYRLVCLPLGDRDTRPAFVGMGASRGGYLCGPGCLRCSNVPRHFPVM